jgi:hypothetical protein
VSRKKRKAREINQGCVHATEQSREGGQASLETPARQVLCGSSHCAVRDKKGALCRGQRREARLPSAGWEIPFAPKNGYAACFWIQCCFPWLRGEYQLSSVLLLHLCAPRWEGKDVEHVVALGLSHFPFLDFKSQRDSRRDRPDKVSEAQCSSALVKNLGFA